MYMVAIYLTMESSKSCLTKYEKIYLGWESSMKGKAIPITEHAMHVSSGDSLQCKDITQI